MPLRAGRERLGILARVIQFDAKSSGMRDFRGPGYTASSICIRLGMPRPW